MYNPCVIHVCGMYSVCVCISMARMCDICSMYLHVYTCVPVYVYLCVYESVCLSM